MGAMTDETKAALQQATEVWSSAQEAADREKATCLTQIAAHLPERAAESAKRIALAQPEVTKALGREGVAAMRTELQAAAEELGQQFVAAVDEIRWPLSEYGKVENRNIHSALFDRFYRKTGALTKVLKDHGYQLGEHDEFVPQYLYDESQFSEVAAALTTLGQAEAKLKKAKKADDDAAVDYLWGS